MGKRIRKYKSRSEVSASEVLKAYEELGSYHAVARKFQLHPSTARDIVLKAKAEAELKRKSSQSSQIDWAELAKLAEGGDAVGLLQKFDLPPEQLEEALTKYCRVKRAMAEAGGYSRTAAEFLETVKPMIQCYMKMGEKKKELCTYVEGDMCVNVNFTSQELPEWKGLGFKFEKDEAGVIRMRGDELRFLCGFCPMFLPKKK